MNEIVDPTVDVGIVVAPENGALIVHVPEIPQGASQPLTQIEIQSTEPLFIPGAQNRETLDGIFDSLSATRLFKSDSSGFGTIDFGPILLPGVTTAQIDSLLEVSGVFADGDAVETAQVVELQFVPEPTTAPVFWMTLAAWILGLRRRYVH